MLKQMHMAAQYLAAAGMSFVKNQDDDSHANLGFNVSNNSLETHILSKNNDQLSLKYDSFSLEWKSDINHETFNLDGARHKDVILWLKKASQAFLNKEYNYVFNYELPYTIEDTLVYKLSDLEELKTFIHYRTLVQNSLKRVITEFHLSEEIRVWPHHFDTGIYEKMNGSDISIGLGLAIPDTVCSQHYFYVSGYNTSGQIDTSGFKKIKKGYWSSKGFMGAVLPINSHEEAEIVEFFREAVNQFAPENI